MARDPDAFGRAIFTRVALRTRSRRETRARREKGRGERRRRTRDRIGAWTRERERRIRRNGGSVINGECGVGKERKDGRKEGREEVKGRGRDSSAVALGTHTHRYGFTSGFGQSRIEIRPVINYGSGLQASSRGSRSSSAEPWRLASPIYISDPGSRKPVACSLTRERATDRDENGETKTDSQVANACRTRRTNGFAVLPP